MTSLDAGGRTLGNLRDALSQHCPQCGDLVFAVRIVGKYVRENNRILIWECPTCNALWRDSKRTKDVIAGFATIEGVEDE